MTDAASGPAAPLVSVLIESYNHERYVAEALDSVLGQSYPNFELIVVDDGSTDSSRVIIEDYARRHAHRMKVHLREENRGISRSSNEALELASGELVTSIGSDDVMMPDALEQRVRYFREHPDVDVLATDFDIIDAEGVIHQGDTRLTLCPQFQRYFEVDFGDVYVELLRGNFLPDIAITVSRARISADDLRYDERCRHLSDWDLWLRIAKRSRWAYLPATTVGYRWHGENVSWPEHAAVPEDDVVAERIYILAKALVDPGSAELRPMIRQRIAWFCG